MSEGSTSEVDHPRWFHVVQAAGEALLVLDRQLRVRWLNARAEHQENQQSRRFDA